MCRRAGERSAEGRGNPQTGKAWAGSHLAAKVAMACEPLIACGWRQVICNELWKAERKNIGIIERPRSTPGGTMRIGARVVHIWREM